MGGYQTEQPVFGKVGVRPALMIGAAATTTAARTIQPEPAVSFHSLFESRQHAIGPDTGFDPLPPRAQLVVGKGRSSLLSQRHCRWCVFPGLGHFASIFLRPFAPPALPGFHATMDALTPARQLFASPASAAAAGDGSNDEHRLVPDRSLCLLCLDFQPFRLQPPHLPRDRFDTLPLSFAGFRIAPVWASPFTRRLAARHGRIEFTCVTDWSFTSRCFPPRLTATQLRSVTGRRAFT